MSDCGTLTTSQGQAGGARTESGLPAHCLPALLTELGTLCRNTVRVTTIDATYQQLTTCTTFRTNAFEVFERKLGEPSNPILKSSKRPPRPGGPTLATKTSA